MLYLAFGLVVIRLGCYNSLPQRSVFGYLAFQALKIFNFLMASKIFKNLISRPIIFLRIFKILMALKSLKSLKFKWAKVWALEKLANH